ncbi:serine/threonine/tyrosine-interacting-like protein 1 isoform X2 [Lepus europaeus]|nr:serine/threonine/tyrosine-interacting-like protein 1 isoform X2 [Lepus europaeus]XP_062035580.1 serine/threonine/tyrosine-interacting-like protein 1 isoform X2 [Lepus europaeus]XP_062035582.1 serine/threonine/tyrosine-interacting-like protein 1 isoform X2 [Lepus europaeus]
MLESVDLECVRYCVVYDSNTSSLEVPLKDGDDEDDEDNADSEDSIHGLASGAAVQYARLLAHLTRHPILILKGGYERFSARYHFFQTQKIIWMPQELDAFQPYPVEILPGRVFLGSFSQACDPKVQKDLKIKAHVNVCMETGPFFRGDAERLLHIPVEDSLEAEVFPFLRHLCHFIEAHLQVGSAVLVFSTQGIGRSCAAVIAFLMHENQETLKEVRARDSEDSRKFTAAAFTAPTGGPKCPPSGGRAVQVWPMCSGILFSLKKGNSFKVSCIFLRFILLGKQSDRDRSSVHWFTPHMAMTARAGPGAQSSLLSLSHGSQGPKYLARHLLPSQVP